jgi:hypothetical protein
MTAIMFVLVSIVMSVLMPVPVTCLGGETDKRA